MSALGMHHIEALQRELSSLPPYRMPEELRRSLHARLVSEATRRASRPSWLGFALGRAATLAAAMVLLLSGLTWATVASAPGDPLYFLKDAITRLIGSSGGEVRPVRTGEAAPGTVPNAAPAELLVPPSIAPAEAVDGAGGPTTTKQPASRPPEPTTPAQPAMAAPSSPPRATPAVPPDPPGPRASPAVPPREP